MTLQVQLVTLRETEKDGIANLRTLFLIHLLDVFFHRKSDASCTQIAPHLLHTFLQPVVEGPSHN